LTRDSGDITEDYALRFSEPPLLDGVKIGFVASEHIHLLDGN